jgi:hypothetical protein
LSVKFEKKIEKAKDQADAGETDELETFCDPEDAEIKEFDCKIPIYERDQLSIFDEMTFEVKTFFCQ